MEDSADTDTGSGRTSGQRMSLTRSDILQLISPNRQRADTTAATASTSSTGSTIPIEDGDNEVLSVVEGHSLEDSILQTVITQLGSQVCVHSSFIYSRTLAKVAVSLLYVYVFSVDPSRHTDLVSNRVPVVKC